jgi:hypothetical protein
LLHRFDEGGNGFLGVTQPGRAVAGVYVAGVALKKGGLRNSDRRCYLDTTGSVGLAKLSEARAVWRQYLADSC